MGLRIRIRRPMAAALVFIAAGAVSAHNDLVRTAKTPHVSATFAPALAVAAPGLQGYVESAEADQLTTKRDAAPTHVILDPKGAIGKAYAARTTPHMYVIDADGVLRYMGGIDDRPTSYHGDVEGANNYVRAALSEMKAGRQVSNPVARPYGCSVKYGS